MNLKTSMNIDSNIELGLERMEKALKLFNIRKDAFECVLIAGTNGKSSTALLLGSILHKHGKNTLVYTSPHLEDPTERVRINGKYIDSSLLEESVRKVSKKIELTGLKLTPFEIFTTTVLKIAREIKPHVLVMEVGLGGRLDATNVLDNSYSIITSIAIDHQEYLGKDITSIAREKAGIIKENSTVITGKLPVKACRVIEEVAQKKNARIIRWKDANAFVTRNIWHALERMLFSRYAHNAVLAIATASLIIKQLDEKKILEALGEFPPPGRGEIVEYRNKKIVIDTAHNPEALSFLLKEVKKVFGRKPVVFLSLLKDKNWRKMLKIADALSSQTFLIQQPTPRGLKRESAPQRNWIEENQIKDIIEKLEEPVVFAGSFWMAKTARRLLCQPSQDAKSSQKC